MPERDQLLVSLVKEVLGPRRGPQEVLRPDEDPLDEYITGVLAPFRAASVEQDAETDLVGEGDSGADDQADSGSDVGAPALDPASLPAPSLDPRARPASLGISFVLSAAASPVVGVACTWARYSRGAGTAWARSPSGEYWPALDCSARGSHTSRSDAGVQLVVRSRQDGTRWHVTLFLVNRTPSIGARATVEEHVFQPEIRIVASDGTQVLPIEEGAPGDETEDSVVLLYRDRLPMARGHLCGAIWKVVDPQRPYPQGGLPPEPPFAWVDGPVVFPPPVAQLFQWPDLRTEYVPSFPISAPLMHWQDPSSAPVLDPAQLCEIWDPAMLRGALEPIPDGYQDWIDSQRVQVASLPGRFQAGATANLDQCQSACNRIRNGIRVLETSADARLAFSFANKAIAMQATWRNRALQWRPFQLAFQLLNLPGLVDDSHSDRSVCDLLWFPTGGGKTEAYLGLAAFSLGFRRLRAQREGRPQSGAGTAVISRYTLRLLTVQQFRRALALITACEWLRVDSTGRAVGWRPRACMDPTPSPWGQVRFSVGLWVGGSVTPNNIQTFQYMDRLKKLQTVRGAIDILEGHEGDGEPAQVLNCPRCDAVLAIPPDGFQRGERRTLHFVLGGISGPLPSAQALSTPTFQVSAINVSAHADPTFCTASVSFTVGADAKPQTIDDWFQSTIMRQLGRGPWLVSARASRPGYFIRETSWGIRRRATKPFEFEIYCPDPACELNTNTRWSEETPCGGWPVPDAFRDSAGNSTRIPIPAWTVDEQVYGRTPSMVIATVDKFARLSFRPEAASMFGNVDRYSEALGYYRSWCPPRGPSTGLPSTPQQECSGGRFVTVEPLRPPELILQDELHLIEGPLGSMVGLYETAIDLLASGPEFPDRRIKYIASTATVRRAEQQVSSIFQRQLAVFPPSAIAADDSFFARIPDSHPADSSGAGRLYVGICAPGRGAQTPTVRLWSRILQHCADRRAAGAPAGDLDPFWTLVGYFNAVRELAAAVALARQDIVQRLVSVSPSPRQLEQGEPVELSSRSDSLELPGLLDHLSAGLGTSQTPANAVVATSMFGTGVDVERLGLMVVHGQPKTTSSYIQATGRVGRRAGGLVVTFLRAARPRDLNHYEFFVGYHSALYRYVEPVTVSPFSPRARDRALGPVGVALLRQAAHLRLIGAPVRVDDCWRPQQRIDGGWFCRAAEMARRRQDPDVQIIPSVFERRAAAQPPGRAPPPGVTDSHAASELDRWQQVAGQAGNALLYSESTMVNPASSPVVLGDLGHLVAGLPVAFENAPNSLRDVEATTTIKGWRNS